MGSAGKRAAMTGGKGYLSMLQLKEKDNRRHAESTTAAEQVGRGIILEIGSGDLSYASVVESTKLRSLLCLKDDFFFQMKKAVEELISKVNMSLGLGQGLQHTGSSKEVVKNGSVYNRHKSFKPLKEK